MRRAVVTCLLVAAGLLVSCEAKPPPPVPVDSAYPVTEPAERPHHHPTRHHGTVRDVDREMGRLMERMRELNRYVRRPEPPDDQEDYP